MQALATRLAPDALRLERLLPGPIDRVWAFLTESDKRGRWLATGDWDLKPGGKVELHFAHESMQKEPTPAKYRDVPMSFTGKVIRVEAPRLIEFTWMESNGVASEVTFELAPRDTKVLLTITHRRITSHGELLDIAGGWDVHTGILEDVLSDQPPRGFWSAHERLVTEYSQRFAT